MAAKPSAIANALARQKDNEPSTNVSADPTAATAPSGKIVHLASAPSEYNNFAVADIPRISKLRHLSPDGIQLEQPIPYYAASSNVKAILAQGGNYSDAPFKDNYYYIMDDSSGAAVYGFDVGPDFNGGGGLREYGGGPSSAAQIRDGLQYLAGLPQVKAGAFETSMMSVDDIVAFWLKSQSGGDDLFYTLTPIIGGGNQPNIPSTTLLTGKDFQSIVSAVMAARVASQINRANRGQ
jgi:hypothetical protein